MKKIYKSLTVSAIVATVSLSALPQSLAITHESQPTKQQRTVLFVKQLVLQIGLVMVHFQIMRIQYKNKVMTLKLLMVIRT
ncbi:putative ABC-type transporter [Staphylococcus aureus]|nr:putative ABC-type transporter [Staphylococcus aureus]